MDNIASPQIDMKLQELEGAVNPYSQYDDTQKKSYIPSFSFNSNHLYIAIPVVLFIVLAVSRPTFVKAEVKMDDGTLVTKTSFEKIIIWTLVIGGLLDIGLYGANYKFNKQKPV